MAQSTTQIKPSGKMVLGTEDKDSQAGPAGSLRFKDCLHRRMSQNPSRTQRLVSSAGRILKLSLQTKASLTFFLCFSNVITQIF